MHITLNIGLEVSTNYLPEGVAGMELQFQYVKDVLDNAFGEPSFIGVAQSATEKTVVAEYTNVDLVLQWLALLADELQQDCIAYTIQYGVNVLGGALVGRYAHEWNYGIFNEAYFIQATAVT